MRLIKLSIIVYAVLCLGGIGRGAELWKTTAYCSCVKCCGKSDGITASGKKAKPGYVACNWLPFGTKLSINDCNYIVMDRGAKSLFGDKKNKIKHIDIWMPSHKEALQYGVKYKEVKIVKE
jgi:3D (Asp-Asp-Asp) domain-containing protein